MINFETEDIMLLYSFVNMKLRDEFLDLDDFVNYYGVDKDSLLNSQKMKINLRECNRYYLNKYLFLFFKYSLI